MAEDSKEFGKVIETLTKTTKKPAAGRAKEVMAVQMVDKKGMPIEGEGGSKGAEKERKKATQDAKRITLLEKIADGMKSGGETAVGGFGKGLKALVGGILKIKKLLIGGVVALLIPAVIGFLNSDAWIKIKKFFVEDFFPFIKKLWKDYLKPIAGFFGAAFMKTWDNIKEAFKGLKEGFTKLFEGDILGGLGKIFGEIGKFVLKQIDAGITLIFNIISKIFGGDGTDSVFQDIINFFWRIYDWVFDTITGAWKAITTGITNAWTFVKDTIVQGWTNVTTFIKGVWDKIVGWFTGLWKWASEGIAGTWKGVTTFIKDVWGKIVGWFSKLWTWASDGIAGTWKGVTTFIKDVWDKIVGWFTKLWEWSSKGIAKGWTNLTNYVTGIWDSVKTWFTKLFSWTSTEDTKESFVVKTIKDVIKAVKKWLGKLFTFDGTLAGTAAGILNVVLFLPNLIKDGLLAATAWLAGLFGFGKAKEDLANASKWSLGSMIVTAFKVVKEWFLGLFGFGKDEKAKDVEVKESEGFSITKILGTAISKIWEFLKGLFDVDIASIAKAFPVVGKIMDLFGKKEKTKEEKEAEKLEEMRKAAAAAEAARIAKEKEDMEKAKKALADLQRKKDQTARRAKDTDKELEELRQEIEQQNLWIKTKGKEGKAQQSFIGLGVDPGDIKDEKQLVAKNEARIEKLLKIQADAAAAAREFNEQAAAPGSIFTHDQGLHDRLDKIFPPELTGRANAMMQANIQKSVDSVGQAGAQGSVNTNISAPVNNAVTNNQGRMSRAPIDGSSGF